MTALGLPPGAAITDDPAAGRAHGGINEFTVRVASVNGSGSASVNGLLTRAMFRMGVPVSGKNLFPSNIQGLPTWYEIRASAAGHTARRARHDLLVAMNTQTYGEDIGSLHPGGYVLYDSTSPLPMEMVRDDVHFLPVPLARLCAELSSDPRRRILMKNIAYAGAVSALLALDRAVVSDLVDESFGGGPDLGDSNQAALRLGYEYAEEHFACPLPFHTEKADATVGHILIDGNSAAALGCLYAGAVVGAWYPITPATSVMENFARLCERYRRVPGVEPGQGDTPENGRNDYLILQAEDELAACGMVIGASWAGARAFTSTSGPGISLMNELLGLAYYTEIPTVIIDVQRAGPSTGMPTRTQQSDILECAFASHGDTRHILLFPADPRECFEFAVQAFDLADRFQTPVIMLSDLDIGMNDWMVPNLVWDDSYVPDRGRVVDSDALAGISEFFRYADPDSESVTPRTFPGVDPKGAYFTRGSGHDRFARYSESPDAYREVVDRLAAKHRASATHVPTPIVARRPGARVGVVTLGSCDLAVREAVELLGADGIAVDYMRIRGYPFGSEVRDFVREHDLCLIVEQNRDAQLRSLLVLDEAGEPSRLRSVLRYGGLPLDARDLLGAMKSELEASVAVY